MHIRAAYLILAAAITASACAESDKASPAVAPQRIVISRPTASVDAGDTLNLHAEIIPQRLSDEQDAVLWISSDERTAIVEDGCVTGLRAGNALIVATTPDGEASDTCKVTVNPELLVLEEYMVSTNNPMQYVNTCDGETNRALTEQEKLEREAMYGLASNMWDDDYTTCFHTNFDIYETDSFWIMREGSIMNFNYIQIELDGWIREFDLEIRNPVDWHRLMKFDVSVSPDGDEWIQTVRGVVMGGNGQWDNAVDRFKCIGAVRKIESITAGDDIRFIRIQPTDGITDVGSYYECFPGIYAAGVFGIAELKIWQRK